MTNKEIHDLLKLIGESELSEVRLKKGEFEMTVRTSKYKKTTVTSQPMMTTSPIMHAPAPVATAAPVAAPAQEAAAPAEATDSTAGLLEVRSPIVGTFYRSSSPDKPVFVSVGDTISEGSVVCIVEAMKLFNEIESEVAGKIVKVMIDDASPVEYDQVLFLVDPKG